MYAQVQCRETKKVQQKVIFEIRLECFGGGLSNYYFVDEERETCNPSINVSDLCSGQAGAVWGQPLPERGPLPGGGRHIPVLLRARLPRQAVPVQVQRVPAAARWGMVGVVLGTEHASHALRRCMSLLHFHLVESAGGMQFCMPLSHFLHRLWWCGYGSTTAKPNLFFLMEF